MRRIFFFASLLAAALSVPHAHGQVVSGECSGAECPLSSLTNDLGAALAASGPCALQPDAALERRFRAGERLSPDDFLRFVAPMAQKSEQKTGVPASVTLAQAALESGWGKTSKIAGKNLFGIKGRGNAGSVKIWTREYIRGRWVRVRATFAAYQTFADSVIAHGRLLSQSPIYSRAMDVRDEGAEAFARALQRAGYATDPQYAAKLMAIIREYDLEAFDGSRVCS